MWGRLTSIGEVGNERGWLEVVICGVEAGGSLSPVPRLKQILSCIGAMFFQTYAEDLFCNRILHEHTVSSIADRYLLQYLNVQWRCLP